MGGNTRVTTVKASSAAEPRNGNLAKPQAAGTASRIAECGRAAGGDQAVAQVAPEVAGQRDAVVVEGRVRGNRLVGVTRISAVGLSEVETIQKIGTRTRMQTMPRKA